MRELRDYLKFLAARILIPSRSLKDWEAKNFHLQKVQLPNSKLTKDLEKLCFEKGGTLTFGEFIAEEMCGKNGFYNTHHDFGKTIVNKVWPQAIFNFCQENSLNLIVEVGSGDGSLGKEVLKLSKKRKANLKWTGIEINRSLWKKIQKNKPQNFVLLKSAAELNLQKNLTIFAYSLDSMPNEVIVNNAMLGVKIANGILEEVLLSENDLKRRGILFKDGIFRTKNYTFDFSAWILHKNQRAYIPINGFLVILDYVKKMKASSKILIIDEMKPSSHSASTYHLATPRILNSVTRDYETLEAAYKNTGDNLWYFPMYLKPLAGFLKELGFTKIKHDGEMRTAAKLKGEELENIGPDLCKAVSASFLTAVSKNSFKIPFPF